MNSRKFIKNKPVTPQKYELYEYSVQTPRLHAETFAMMYVELLGKAAKVLREDFCGTFAICCSWVKMRKQNISIGLDLDPEPIDYGKRNHLSKLKPSQQKRVLILQKNVQQKTIPKADIVSACNFSFCIFKTRKDLKKYFKAAFDSLNKKGIFVLEMAGGPGMIKTMKEKTEFKHPKHGRYTYIWDQKSFDPITHDAEYAIHFYLKNGIKMKNVFTYDWRLWTIPEITDLMKEVGFKEAHVYWELSKDGEGTGEYARQKKGENDYAWVVYVAGEKK